jgi:hypothetical protein
LLNRAVCLVTQVPWAVRSFILVLQFRLIHSRENVKLYILQSWTITSSPLWYKGSLLAALSVQLLLSGSGIVFFSYFLLIGLSTL